VSVVTVGAKTADTALMNGSVSVTGPGATVGWNTPEVNDGVTNGVVIA
jgi:hypothetical protein